MIDPSRKKVAAKSKLSESNTNFYEPLSEKKMPKFIDFQKKNKFPSEKCLHFFDLKEFKI